MENASSTGLVTVYWRPGCMYCAALRRGLRRAGLATTEVNIWADPEAAAKVRSIAHGNETVPTVLVGGTEFVNPPVRVVLEAVCAVAPQMLGNGALPTPSRVTSGLAAVQWIVVVALVIASFVVEAAGHAGASWALDGVALAWYLGLRALRQRLT